MSVDNIVECVLRYGRGKERYQAGLPQPSGPPGGQALAWYAMGWGSVCGHSSPLRFKIGPTNIHSPGRRSDVDSSKQGIISTISSR